MVKLDVDLEEQLYYRQIFCHRDRWVAPFMGRMMELIKGYGQFCSYYCAFNYEETYGLKNKNITV